MKELNISWLKDNLDLEILKLQKDDIKKIANCYKDIFNGSPFFENWTNDMAESIIKRNLKSKCNIMIAKKLEEVIGFLISSNNIPKTNIEYIPYNLNEVRFIKDIGVLENYRRKSIASELTRIDLINLLNDKKKYIIYITNMMRYFIPKQGESFITALERVQIEDRKDREIGNKIIVPNYTIEEKNEFTNKYIEIIKKVPELDVSNSNQLFRKIFGELDFCNINGQYQWRVDPTGLNNDRIYPVIELEKILKKEIKL